MTDSDTVTRFTGAAAPPPSTAGDARDTGDARHAGDTGDTGDTGAPEPPTGASGIPGRPKTRPNRTGTFAAMQVPNFRLFLGGQVISLCGTWMQTIALGWLVLSLGASGTALGLVTAAQFVPVLLFGAYGGLIADRADARRLLIGTQIALGLLAALIGVLDLTGAARLWMVAALAAAIGLISAVDNPTRQSFVQEMVGPEFLPNAITLNSVAMNAARIVGPAIAGLMITVLGTGGCFLLNAASFVAVVVALHRLDTAALLPRRPVPRAPGQVRAGLAYVMRTPALRTPLVMMAVIGALSYEFQVVLPLVARESFHGTAATYSLLTGAMGAGAVAGGLLVARYRRVGLRALALTAGMFGAVTLVAAAAPVLALEVAALVAVGAASVAFISTGNATVQLACAPEMRGRVLALWSVAFIGSTPVGGPIAGWVAETFGARAGLLLAGLAALAGAAYALASLRARPADPTTGEQARDERTAVTGTCADDVSGQIPGLGSHMDDGTAARTTRRPGPASAVPGRLVRGAPGRQE